MPALKRVSREERARQAAEFAWQWIQHKYRTTARIPEYYLSRTGRFPKYQHRLRRVRIVEKRVRWATYIKKRVGVYADWIPCTQFESWVLQFVHEFTHAVQGDEHRKYSEVETTQNEIDCAREHFPHLHRQLTPIQRIVRRVA
jgi:hypothetical protein